MKAPTWVAMLRPPRRSISYGEFARTLILPDGPHQGEPWRPDTEPAQQCALQAMDGGSYKRFVFAWAQQCGKSLIGMLLPAIKGTCVDGQKVGYILPTLEVLERNWIDKIKPGYIGCGYGGWLPEKGPGSRGGRPKALRLHNPETRAYAGSMVFMAAGTVATKETNLSSSTVNPVLVDEADDMMDLRHIDLALGRASAFGKDAVAYISSTVNKDENSIILHLWATATGGRLWYPCPHCGRFQPFDLQHIRYEGATDAEVNDSARLVCKHNGCMITESERHRALDGWRYVEGTQIIDEEGTTVGRSSDGNSWSLLCGQLDFHLGLGIGDLAVEHMKAKKAIDQMGDHSAMRYYYQKRHSQQYEADHQAVRITSRGLALLSSRSRLFKRQVPAWAEFLTVALDCQMAQVYWLVMAHGVGGKWAIVDWGYEHIGGEFDRREHSEEEYHATFDVIAAMVSDGWQIEGTTTTLRPVRGGIDSGYKEDVVLSWIAAHPGWHALKGRTAEPTRGHPEKEVKSGSKRVLEVRGWIEVRRLASGEMLFFVDTNHARMEVHRGLMLEQDSPGSGSLPRDTNGEPLPANGDLCLHLSAEIWTLDEKTGRWYWRQTRKRNDHLDLSVYNLSLARFETAHPSRRPTPQPMKADRPMDDAATTDAPAETTTHAKPKPAPKAPPSEKPKGKKRPRYGFIGGMSNARW